MMTDQLTTITENIQAAKDHLDRLRHAMAALEADGMYPAVPSREVWEDRGGAAEYLYLHFSTDRYGNFQGPDGKRKIYVGCKPEKLEQARRKIRNREHYNQLETIERRLNSWLANIERDLQSLTRQAENWPQLDDKLWKQLPLGQEPVRDPEPG